jgi:mRNA-degrading endonuclease toxin of MazEF toxin-antitoxin module
MSPVVNVEFVGARPVVVVQREVGIRVGGLLATRKRRVAESGFVAALGDSL